MYNQINADTLTKAGQFALSDIQLISYQSSNGGSEPKKVSVRSLVLEINIYEDIFSKGLSGNVVLLDGQNLTNHLPLTGFERIEFKLNTPGIAKGFDFTSTTGHPMYIYKISGRQEMTPRTQMYVLHFASKEILTNETKKIYRTMSGTIDDMVLDIFRNDLESKKTLILEETKGIRKYVPVGERPFDFIEGLSKSAESARYNNSGMYFYEDSTGFRFRSLENMLAITDGAARPVVARFEKKPRSIKGGTGITNIIQEMQTVDGFTIDNQFDTIKNLRNGVYASRTISHDMFNKTYTNFDYDYNLEFENIFHTEHDGSGGKTDNKSIAPLINYHGKQFSDFADTALYLQSTTTNTHDNFEDEPKGTNMAKRLAQRMAFAAGQVSLTARGFTGLSCGDVVALEIPAYEPAGVDNPLDNDPYMSGRYLVKSIRHKIDTAKDMHTMAINTMKDAVRVAYPEESIDTFTGRENAEATNILQYDLDDMLITEASKGDNDGILS